MEFFERAHVATKISSRKDRKSKENVKKQLKQMLYGYKNSDNELIKNCANANYEAIDVRGYLEDSTSVSGFSDLSLTSFNNEADTTQETTTSTADDEILAGNKEIDASKYNNSDTSEGSSIASLESISECDEDIQSLSEDVHISADSSCSAESNLSFNPETSTDVDSTGSEAFDADGSLATRILEKLGKKGNIVTKRKINKLEKINKTHNDSNKLYKRRKNESELDTEMSNVLVKTMDQSDEWCQNDSNSVNDSVSSHNSSPYISLTATDMQTQSLSEILGDYRHSTIKNIPSDKQNIVLSTNNSGIFLSDSMSIDGTYPEDEIGSLIPELDEDQLIEDLETDIDTSILPNTEETAAYDDTIQSELTEKELESSTENTEAKCVNSVKVYYGKNGCIFVMKHPTEIHVHGKVMVKALGGTVKVLGYTLQKETCELYAPNCYYAHCLKTVEAINAYYGLFGKLTLSGLSVSEAEEIVTTMGEYDAVLSVSKLCSRKMEFVENNFKVVDLFSKRIDHTHSFRKASELLGCSLYMSKPRRYFDEKGSWEEAVSCGLSDQSRGIVCGGKGTGKSTFLRYYVNRLLARGPVLVVDLDPGQAEFTPPGNISVSVVTEPLLGPSFTHLRQPEKMLNIGMINTMDSPARYTAAVDDLLTFCRNNATYQTMPWIINTMGMCNNMGLKFISLITLLVQPTFLLQISSKSAKKRFDYDLDAQTIRKLYFEGYIKDKLFEKVRSPHNLDYTFIMPRLVENSDTPKYSTLTPKDERYLNVLAYFGELLNLHTGVGLLEIVPYQVNLYDVSIGTNVKVLEDAVTKVINGKVIALCQHRAQDKAKMFTLEDKALLCHGHGLIRGIDFEKGVLYIITPTPVDKLCLVNALVYADWMPELRGQDRYLPCGVAVPYRTATVYQHRQLMASPRRRFNPLQLLKMTRSS